MTGPDNSTAASPKRLLIVDDDAAVREGMARALRARGFAVETALNGMDARFKLKRWRPHLIVLDVVMPGLDGLEICRHVREAAVDDPKILVLTGYPGEGHAARSVINGADLFLSKPQALPKLIDHINDLLEG